jgi:hypothetical protein
MGIIGTSKDLPFPLDNSTENYPASSDTYRRPVESSQTNFATRKFSCFVLIGNVLPGSEAGPADISMAKGTCGKLPDSL